MGLAPSPGARSTQDMGSLWSTTVESMRESTGFKGPLRCQRPSRHGEACVTRHQDHHQPALLRTSPRILRLAQWRRRCRCCRAGGGSLPLDPSDPVPGRRGPERRRRPRPGGTGTPCLLTALAAVSAVDNTVRSPDRGSGSSRQRTLRRCPVPQPPDTPQVHRRPRHPRGCWRSGGRCSPTGSRRSRAAAPSPTSTRPSTATSRTRWSGRRAAPRRSSSRSGRAWCSSSSRRSGPTPSRPWSGLHPPGRRVLGRQPQHRAARQPAGRAAVDRVLHRPPRPRYLHHNFVVALLNDLFGIQSRGGCSCAGPYGHRLLGIDIESRPSTWSPTRAGSCSATTASIPPPACGATARARSSPPAPG
jgi:hypothetical protein